MTTRTELLETVANGESSAVEFKRDDITTPDLAKELVAFANFEGGEVLLGVEDDGTVSGLVRSDLEQWVMNVCRDKITPPIIPFFEVVKNVADGKDVAVVRVASGLGVHALEQHGSKRYLIRVATQSYEASQEELARLFRQKGAIRAELQPVSGTARQHLDQRRLRNYFVDVREQGDIPADTDEAAWQSLLINTDIMTEDGVTLGGMLLFAKDPNKFLPYAGIDAFAFSGTGKDYDTQERAVLRGALTPLLSASGDIVENGLVEQALYFVQRNTRVTIEQKGGRRVEKPVYPHGALREGIVNALIHRDYLSTGTNIELSIYSDRLEIISPGRLPNGVTPDGMRVGARASRNQMLKDVMRDYRYLESMGMGVSRKIIKGMREHNGTEPDLVAEHGRFIVRLHA